MIERLIALCLRNKFLTVAVVVVLVLPTGGRNRAGTGRVACAPFWIQEPTLRVLNGLTLVTPIWQSPSSPKRASISCRISLRLLGIS